MGPGRAPSRGWRYHRLPAAGGTRPLTGYDLGSHVPWSDHHDDPAVPRDGRVLPHTLFRSRAGGANGFRYRSAAMDDLIDRSRRTADPRDRAWLLAALDDLAAREVPAVPLWGRQHRYHAGDQVQGLERFYLPYHFPLGHVRLLARQP